MFKMEYLFKYQKFNKSFPLLFEALFQRWSFLPIEKAVAFKNTRNFFYLTQWLVNSFLFLKTLFFQSWHRVISLGFYSHKQLCQQPSIFLTGVRYCLLQYLVTCVLQFQLSFHLQASPIWGYWIVSFWLMYPTGSKELKHFGNT